MENKIKYSILIPAYNVENYIKRCLNSIFNQTLKNINMEIIVCDDGSTDNTFNILKSFNNIKLLHNEVNSRGVITRNRLIRESRGEYIIWVDADDTLEPNFFEVIEDKLNEKKYDIIDVSFNYIQDNKIINFSDKKDKIIHKESCIDEFFQLSFKWVLWAKVIKREIAIKQLPPDKYQEFDDIFFTLPLYFYCKNYCSVSDRIYNYYVYTGYWSKTLQHNYNMSLNQFKNILLTRIEEWKYNSKFLKDNNLFEKYKMQLLSDCDLNSLFNYLIKIENQEERHQALEILNKFFGFLLVFRK